MIQLTFKPEHLDAAVACTAKFRDRSGHRPALAAMHVRFEPDSDRTRVQFTATDSYHLVRVSVPVEQVKDPQSWLTRRGGVLLDLPGADTRRALATMRQVEKARAKREADDERMHAHRTRSARALGNKPPAPFKKGAATLAQLTVATGGDADVNTTGFALGGDGRWTGGGCYVTAVGDRAGLVGKVVGGQRVHRDYPDVDGLIAKSADESDNGSLRVAYNPELLGDICAAAAMFQKSWNDRQAPMIVDKVARLNPTLFTSTRPDGCTFLGLIMPVRVS